MGIKGLGKLIRDNIPSAIRKKKLYELNNKVIAIDTNYYLYKYSISTSDFILKFGQQYEHLCSYGIKPLYVFDGKPPKEKQKVIEKRKHVNIKKNIEVSIEKITRLKEFFDSAMITYIECYSEADFICSKLAEIGEIHGCITDDMDFLALGCPYIYRDYHQTTDYVFEYSLYKIYELFPKGPDDSTTSREQFIDLCIYLGCDYCDKIKEFINRKARIDIIELLKNYKTLENIWAHLKCDGHILIDSDMELLVVDKWKKARDILMNIEVYHTTCDISKIKLLKLQKAFTNSKRVSGKRVKEINTIAKTENKFSVLE
jgi:flap endonuclease-1